MKSWSQLSINITLESFKIFLNLYDTLARTAFDLAEDEETEAVIEDFQEKERQAKLAKQASIRSKLLLSQKKLKQRVSIKSVSDDTS